MTLETRTLNVKIPKGVRAGQVIRLAGQGAPGMGGGTAGDLLLEGGVPDDVADEQEQEVIVEEEVAEVPVAQGEPSAPIRKRRRRGCCARTAPSSRYRRSTAGW